VGHDGLLNNVWSAVTHQQSWEKQSALRGVVESVAGRGGENEKTACSNTSLSISYLAVPPVTNNVHRDISHIASSLWSRLATTKAKMDDMRSLEHR
jgi:hypothetical protein